MQVLRVAPHCQGQCSTNVCKPTHTPPAMRSISGASGASCMGRASPLTRFHQGCTRSIVYAQKLHSASMKQLQVPRVPPHCIVKDSVHCWQWVAQAGFVPSWGSRSDRPSYMHTCTCVHERCCRLGIYYIPVYIYLVYNIYRYIYFRVMPTGQVEDTELSCLLYTSDAADE